MEWPNDVALEFLRLYGMETAIWNPKDPYHRDRSTIYEGWKRIEKSLSEHFKVKFAITELRKKKDSLMATYRKLSRTKLETGDESEPDWFAYELMDGFLHDIYQPRQPKQLESTNDETLALVDTEESVNNRYQLKKLKRSSLTRSDELKRVNAWVSKKRKSQEESYDQEPCFIATTEKDEFSVYTDNVACKLRKLHDTHAVSIVQHIINTALFEAEMGLYKNGNALQGLASVVVSRYNTPSTSVHHNATNDCIEVVQTMSYAT